MLRTRACGNVEEALVATTDPRHFTSPRQQAAYAAATAGAKLVRYGGDCYCYTQVAMGLTDVVIETGLQAYDVQALIPLIEAAGGAITDWSGGPCHGGRRRSRLRRSPAACGADRAHRRGARRL